MKKFFGEGGRRGRWLIVLGAALLIYSLVMLYSMEPLAQYIAPAQHEPEKAAQMGEAEGDAQTAAESPLAEQQKLWEQRRNELGENAQAGMAAVAYGFNVSGGGQSETATLICAGQGWFDAHPRFLVDGCLFSGADYENGVHKAVLDEELAFQLFPTTDACGSRVQLDDVWYDVVGVVRRADSAGDTDDYRIYIPLNAAVDARMQTDYVQIDCRSELSGAKRALQSVAEEALGGGSYYDTSKEVMRATMIVRVIAIIFALYFIARLLRAWNRRTVALVNGWLEEVKHRYFKTMLPGVIGLSALQLAGYCALALSAWATLRLTIEPMYVFTEWIPEVIVEWSKLAGRAQELMRDAAQVARYHTREYAAIRFYGALTRWGVICTLAGLVLYRVWPKPRHREM